MQMLIFCLALYNTILLTLLIQDIRQTCKTICSVIVGFTTGHYSLERTESKQLLAAPHDREPTTKSTD